MTDKPNSLNERCSHCGAELDVTEMRRHFARLGGLKGGRARSKAKTEAARRNGKLGGRPRKNPAR